MTSHRDDIRDAVKQILAGSEPTIGAPIAHWDAQSWTNLTESGFADLGIDEESGGSGGDVTDAVDVVATIAASGVCVPIIEHGLACWVVTTTGLDKPTGTGTIGEDSSGIVAEESSGTVLLSGRISAVPWASIAQWLAVFDGHSVAVVDLAADGLVVHPGTDVLGAPLCDVVMTGVVAHSHAPTTVSASQVRSRGAALYSAAMAGSARAVVDATIRHTSDRTQFGRPLAKFQAVQQRLAQLASTVAQMERAVDEAAEALATDSPRAAVALTSAKVVVSGAAADVAAAGHQLHGAIGFTREHALGRYTGSLHSWRNRWGSADDWARILASQILDDGPDLWDLVTGGSDATSSDATIGARP